MTEKRFTSDGWKITVDGENIGMITACELLNELNDENKQLQNDCSILVQSNQEYRKENEQLKQQLNCYKSRIQLLSPLLDLADAIIDLSDDEKSKAFWEKRNNEVEQKWEEVNKECFND